MEFKKKESKTQGKKLEDDWMESVVNRNLWAKAPIKDDKTSGD
jgi:hypothetical protein